MDLSCLYIYSQNKKVSKWRGIWRDLSTFLFSRERQRVREEREKKQRTHNDDKTSNTWMKNYADQNFTVWPSVLFCFRRWRNPLNNHLSGLKEWCITHFLMRLLSYSYYFSARRLDPTRLLSLFLWGRRWYFISTVPRVSIFSDQRPDNLGRCPRVHLFYFSYRFHALISHTTRFGVLRP